MPIPDDVPKNPEEAFKLSLSGWWTDLSPREVVSFQLNCDWTCMDWEHFLTLLCEVLDRPISSVELTYGGIKNLRDEFNGKCHAPTWKESMDSADFRKYQKLSPEDKWKDYLKEKAIS